MAKQKALHGSAAPPPAARCQQHRRSLRHASSSTRGGLCQCRRPTLRVHPFPSTLLLLPLSPHLQPLGLLPSAAAPQGTSVPQPPRDGGSSDAAGCPGRECIPRAPQTGQQGGRHGADRAGGPTLPHACLRRGDPPARPSASLTRGALR